MIQKLDFNHPMPFILYNDIGVMIHGLYNQTLNGLKNNRKYPVYTDSMVRYNKVWIDTQTNTKESFLYNLKCKGS